MRPRILIPLLFLMLACISPSARAGGTHCGHSAHAHLHKHGSSAHLHTHTESRTDCDQGHDPCAHACDDESHSECCGNHDHHPEQFPDGLTPRERELPPLGACIASNLPEIFRSPPRELSLRWAPLRQRPPDYLGSLRTCVMLN